MIEQYMKTDIGKREYNEDFVKAFTAENIKGFVLCDGLGGCGLGNLAAEDACENFISKFQENTGDIKERIDKAMLFCNEALCNLQDKTLRPGGLRTTLCALITDEKLAYIVHCGDSRVYHFANGKYVWRTKDHSVPQLMALMGEIEENEIRKHIDRNKLLRAIGMGREDFTYEIKSEPVKLCGNDAFMLCSDGFWEYINGSEMARFLVASKSVKDWIELMFNQIKRRSVMEDADNCTGIAILIKNASLFDKENEEAIITLSPSDDKTEVKTEEPVTSSSDYPAAMRKIILPTDIKRMPCIKDISSVPKKAKEAVYVKTKIEESADSSNEIILKKELIRQNIDDLL